MPTPTAYLSATEILAGYASGELTPSGVVGDLLGRIGEYESVINATTREPMPIDEAIAESERRWLEGDPRPLEGVPIIFKEEQPIEGFPATEGTPLFADEVADVTHPLVERIIAAGAIPIARSTTPEFCIAGYTRGGLWGITRNPWNPDFAVGGSSGGSGASLAAGYSPLATGSDIGGSTRIPSSFNGVVGYKPPFGRNPALAINNLDSYCTDGPMARTVADVALLQNVIAGQHADDPVSLPNPPHLEPNADLTGKRVALAPTLGNYGVQDDVRDAIAQTQTWLEAAGATVDIIDIPFDAHRIMETAWAHFGSIFVPWIKDVVGEDRLNQLEPYTRQAAEFTARYWDELGIYGGLQREAEVHAELAEVFKKYDALVCPTAGLPAFKADDYYEDGITVAGVEYESHVAAALTVPFNIANRNPVLCVPVCRSADNVPIGAQVVARPYDDETVFDVGAAIEAGRGRWYIAESDRPTFERN